MEFFSNNPTLVLTLLYIYVTAIGLIYSAALYGKFGINIFDYSEIGDFLLAAFKNPVAFLSGLLFAAIAAAVVALMRRELRQWDNPRRVAVGPLQAGQTRQELTQLLREQSKRRVRRWMVSLTISLVLVGIFSTLILPYFSAVRMASSIKHGQYPAVDVRYRSFKGSAGQVTKPDLTLIGATQKAVFFYDTDDEHTIVIPQAQIVSIEVPE